MDELAESADRYVAASALQWKSHLLENAGDPGAAIDAVERALALMNESVDGPWQTAILRTHLAGLHMQLGHPGAARPLAHTAMPVLERLGAIDDLIQLRLMLALGALSEGRLDEAETQLEQVDGLKAPNGIFGGALAHGLGAAELALARGDRAAGLVAYRGAAAHMRAFALPGHVMTGAEPWVLLGDSSALAAFAHYATSEDEAEGTELFDACRAGMARVLEPGRSLLDYPVYGLALFAVGAWGLLRSALPAADAVRLLVLAERFAYNRMIPTMAWEKIEPCAEERAPGRIAALRVHYGHRRGPDLIDEARRAVEQIGSVGQVG
jgi:hypothetical protein